MNKVRKDRVVAFAWQHAMLLVSLFVLAFGVALCVRSNLGSSVISSAPYALTLAGEAGIAPAWSLGMYTNVLNVLLVIGQIAVLRRRFQPVQLLQLAIGVVFGLFIDLSMGITAAMGSDWLPMQLLVMVGGCTTMALGVAMEVRCASITMPGEGLPVALSRVTGRPFADMKICVDISLVGLAVVAMMVCFGHWVWEVVGVGTLFAMVYIGFAVKQISRRMGWFDRLLRYRPGFRRYVYGLARFLQSSSD